MNNSTNTTFMNIDTFYEDFMLTHSYLSDFEELNSTVFNILFNNSVNFTYLLENSNLHPNDTNNRDPISVILPITISYCLIFLAGILGNIATCIVIAQNKSMHTATNYYLFNLAVSDVLLLIFGMPADIYGIWYPLDYPFSQAVCVLQGVLSETATNATVLTITSFTIERYIAICFPFRSHTMSKLSRAIKFIIAIWLLALCLAAPQALQFGLVHVGSNGRVCTMKNRFMEHAFAVSGFVFFVGPMTIICVLYILIGIKLRQSKLMHNCKRNRNIAEIKHGINAQSRVIRMLIAVVITFFICWAPFHAQRLMAVYNTNFRGSHLFIQIYTILNYISGVLYFLSTCINPILYNIMSHKFRNASKLTLSLTCLRRRFNRNSQNRQTYSAISKNGIRCADSFKLTTINNRNHGVLKENELNDSMLDADLVERARDKSNYEFDRRLARCTSTCSQTTMISTVNPTDLSITASNTDNVEIKVMRNNVSKLGSIAEIVRRGTKRVQKLSKTNTIIEVPNIPERKIRIKSNNSIDSNTISNSSLQELADEELTTTELAKYMGKINLELDSR